MTVSKEQPWPIVTGVQEVVGGSLPNVVERGEELGSPLTYREQIELLKGGMSPHALSALILSLRKEEADEN